MNKLQKLLTQQKGQTATVREILRETEVNADVDGAIHLVESVEDSVAQFSHLVDGQQTHAAELDRLLGDQTNHATELIKLIGETAPRGGQGDEEDDEP
eukprot:SAG31_NODE_3087_length_4690_cov_30.948377_4_plen_98_part_00